MRVLPTPGSPASSTVAARAATGACHSSVSRARSAVATDVAVVADPTSAGEIGHVGPTSHRAPSSSGSHSTRHAGTGSASPFRSSSPIGSNAKPPRPRARARTSSAASTSPPPAAAAQARCLDDRHAEHVAVLGGHVADRQADANREGTGGLATAVRVDRLLHRDRAGDRVGGGLEGGQDPVAEALDHGAAVCR